MSFLISLVFFDEMKVVTTNDYRSFHFHALYNTSKDTSSDANVTSEWTFFIDICSFYSLEQLLKIDSNHLIWKYGMKNKLTECND